MNKSKLKKMLDNKFFKKITSFCLWLYNHLPFNNSFKTHHNKVVINCSKLTKCKFNIKGKNNTVIIDQFCQLKHCQFTIIGNGNTIHLSQYVVANHAEFYTEDNGNQIICGNHTIFAGKIHLAAIENTTILIGNNCLFSSDIVLRSGDSHSILDLNGNRINPSKNITIGNHVWIGHRALINKGVTISDDCVVGTGSVVTKQFDETNIIIAGNPAKCIKQNTKWTIQRIDTKKHDYS